MPSYIAGLAGTGLGGYFRDQNGAPRFLLLEQCWALPWNAGRWNSGNWQSDMDAYMSARAGQGHTAWYGVAWGQQHVDSTALTGGRTWDGIYPLIVNGTAGAITTGSETISLNNSFWTRIDYLFNSALAQGISCFLNLGLEYDFTDTGGIWQHLSTTQASAFGAALAARYPQASYPHVFWFFGDDSFGTTDTYFANILSGAQGAGDTRTLVSVEHNSETNSHIEFDTGTAYGTFGAASATYNWTYTYSPTYLGVEDGYTETAGFTKIPVVWGDGPYYGDTDNSTPDYTIRRFAWWSLASGARGINSTSGPSDLAGSPLFKWPSTAVADLTTDPNGTWITSHNAALLSYFAGLAGWHQLIPDTGNVFVTAGRGTRGTSPGPGGAPNYGNTDGYVAASITPAGTLAVIYSGQHFSITVNQAKMVPGYTATWVDPLSLAQTATTAGSTYNSTPLGNNSAGNPDWALVLQAPAAAGPVIRYSMRVS
jgi:hypothetical protein